MTMPGLDFFQSSLAKQHQQAWVAVCVTWLSGQKSNLLTIS
jgi:hypothetical protein